MNLTPNTKEWLLWRMEGIGSSDSPIIMGKSKYKTTRQLWEEKVKKEIDEDDIEPNYIQQKGHKLEAWARPGIEFQTGRSWRPATFIHPQFSFIRATLDGYQPETKEVWECKFMGKEPFLKLKDETLALRQRIPYEYFDQIMHHFFVTGCQLVKLTGIIETKDENKIVTREVHTLDIPMNEEFQTYIKEKLAPKLFAFWKMVEEKTPPEINEQDRVIIDDHSLGKAILKYGELVDQEKKLKAIASEKSKEILGDVGEKIEAAKSFIEGHPARVYGKMEHEGFLITEVPGSESVDYKAALDAFFGWIRTLKQCADPGSVVVAIREFPDEPSLVKYTSVGAPYLKITPPKKEEAQPKKEKKKRVKSIRTEDDSIRDTKAKIASWKTMNPAQQKVQARENVFRDPISNLTPPNWDTMLRREKAQYLRSVKAKTQKEQKLILKLADDLDNFENLK